MGAAAKFTAEFADTDDTDLIAVLFVEQGNSAGLAGFVQSHHIGDDRVIALNSLVDQLFDSQFFVGCHWLIVTEVKAQTVG